MKEKELRLALVCFGGISLAIYIHGATKEILKLARASKAFHSEPDINSESRKRYIYPNEDLIDQPDTELVYFDILKALSPDMDLRVIVDVIAGASAGGMNSIFLGRALAHDLSMDHLRHHWLEEADVSRLVGDKKPAGRLDKVFSKPLIHYLSSKYLGQTPLAEQVKLKLPALMNVWKLKPPFDGQHFLGLMYNSLSQMGGVKHHSLMPYGHRLDLYVTVTDYFGFHRVIPLNDPPLIQEREHRHKLHFSYLNKENHPGEDTQNPHNITSDFDVSGIPGLSFAARATACFPGAFPPAQLREVDHFMKNKGKKWTAKAQFIKHNFREYARANLDPMATSFLDGSILNNKPFDQAISAIQGRPAFREVERRIIYIDPNPEKLLVTPTGAPPSPLNTIKGALSDIPMNEPMHDDLMDIQTYNQQIRTIRTVIDTAKPDIEALVSDISGERLNTISTAEEIEYLRVIANIRSVTDAGYSYGGYARLKVRNTVANLTNIIGDICGFSSGTHLRRRLFNILHNMAFRDKFDFSDYQNRLEEQSASGLMNWVKGLIQKQDHQENMPSWGFFLTKFDIKYQRRRLLFIIKDLNTHYSLCPEDAKKLDELKKTLYGLLEELSSCAEPANIPFTIKEYLRATFQPLLKLNLDDHIQENEITKNLEDYMPGIQAVLNQLADVLNLDQYKNKADQLIAEQTRTPWKSDLAKSLAVSYIGFSFWDVTTFSIMGSKELGEFDEIKINRISPKDKSVINGDKDHLPLCGTAMGGFGAFFSRADRENDYLWGRLNSAERLIDLLYNQAKDSGLHHKLNIQSLKKKAFTTILDVEEPYLKEASDLITKIREKVNNL
ncbi:patatin-like protein [Paremcibacter congregatus]|uniref:patatin-like protein n=1 Tax=Paremcibacter congregatus TaxID=2043170 RepID=UPI0030EE09C9|tara:strand:- start:23022 stop:25538 length:2517 start_codon:yes stop_codon:yes gene_type:complete